MYSITFLSTRPKARQIEFVHPIHDFSHDETPFEFNVYYNSILLGRTKNRILNFTELLQDSYRIDTAAFHLSEKLQECDINSQEFNELANRIYGLTPTQGQLFMTIINKCPYVLGGDLSDPNDNCWTMINIDNTRIASWKATPVTKVINGKKVNWVESTTSEPIKAKFTFNTHMRFYSLQEQQYH